MKLTGSDLYFVTAAASLVVWSGIGAAVNYLFRHREDNRR
jgi:hypothetical protein